jgi:hypothetical protein
MRAFLLFQTVLWGAIGLPAGPVRAADAPSSHPPAESFPGPARLVMPREIPALAELETNLYFDNVSLLLNPGDFLPDVTCPKGAQQNHRWTWTPKPEEAGDHPLTLELRDARNRIVARGGSVVRVKLRKLASIPAKRAGSTGAISTALWSGCWRPSAIGRPMACIWCPRGSTSIP